MEYELMRLKLSTVSTLEKAELIVALRKKWETEHGAKVRVGRPKKEAPATGGFFKMVCESTGMALPTVQRLWRIGHAIPADLAAALSGSPIAFQTTKLVTIAGLSSEEQGALLSSIQAGADVASQISSAAVPLDDSEKEYNRFIGTWRSLRPETRMRFLSTLANAA